MFEKLGARFQNIWFSFGAGEYDFVAVVEVPASADIAALFIAAQADWAGKPFDKISITPLLNGHDASIARQRAAQALGTIEDGTAAAPPPRMVMANRPAQSGTGPLVNAVRSSGASVVEEIPGAADPPVVTSPASTADSDGANGSRAEISGNERSHAAAEASARPDRNDAQNLNGLDVELLRPN
ncbi:MAG TPA: hypothetical protein VMD51_10335, partial [Mycobacterium sp.]|nr:hypothetical protein [Mycobacterium sp.]